MGARNFGIKTAFVANLGVKPDALRLERSVLTYKTLYNAMPLVPPLCTKAYIANLAALHTFAVECRHLALFTTLLSTQVAYLCPQLRLLVCPVSLTVTLACPGRPYP